MAGSTTFPTSVDDFAGTPPRKVVDLEAALVAVESLLLSPNAVNVMSYGAISGGSAATNTTALNNARAAVVATGKPGSVRIPEGVDLPVTPDGVIGASNVRYFGGGKLSTAQTTAGALITFPSGSVDFGVEGLIFSSPNDAIVAVYIKSATSSMSRRGRIVGNRCIECTMVDTNDLTIVYSACSTHVTTGNVTRELVILGNTGIRSATAVGTKAFLFLYLLIGAEISGNRSRGYYSHIQWFGGDANPASNGAVANERKCGDFAIANEHAYAVLGGGIWGSMGKDISVVGGLCNGSSDVGFDCEGGVNVSFSGGTAVDCNNGGVTTFWYNRNVRFTGMTVETSFANGTLGRIYNAGQSPDNRDVTISESSFECTNGIGFIAAEVCGSLNLIDLTLTNCAIDTVFNNQGDTTIRVKQVFLVAFGSAFDAIKTGSTAGGICDIRSEVYTRVAQPSGSRACRVSQATVSTSLVHIVCRGWPDPPVTIACSPASAAVPTVWVSGHFYDGSGIERMETGSLGLNFGRVWIKAGELSNAGGAASIPATTPTTGRWDVGQRVYFGTPTASGKIGAVCVTAGTPGTWKSFGVIDA